MIKYEIGVVSGSAVRMSTCCCVNELAFLFREEVSMQYSCSPHLWYRS